MALFLYFVSGFIGALWFRWVWCREERLDFYNPSPIGIVLVVLGSCLGFLMFAGFIQDRLQPRELAVLENIFFLHPTGLIGKPQK